VFYPGKAASQELPWQLISKTSEKTQLWDH
jgi:hypothetical protein